MTNSEKLKELYQITITSMREYSIMARAISAAVSVGRPASTDGLRLQDAKFRDFRSAMEEYNNLLRALTKGAIAFDDEYQPERYF